MRKKYLLIIICLILFRASVNATSLSVGLSCPGTAYPSTTVSCTISSSVGDGMINGINANYSFSNASYQNFTAGGGWNVYNSTSNGFAIGNTNGSSGGTLGTLTVLVNGDVGASATVSLVGIGASDTNFEDVSTSNRSATINIIEKPAPVTTTRKKVVYLSDLSVNGYDIGFNRSTFNYVLDVGYEVTTITLNASSANGYSITGTGDIHVNEGENTVLVVVTDKDGESSTYTIKVNRVVKVDNKINNSVEEADNAFKSNKDLIINLTKNKDELIVKKEMLDLIKGNKRTLTYNILDGNNIMYSYIFDGSKFNEVYNDIDLSIDFNINKKDVIDKILNDKKVISFKTNYTGYYPNGTILKIKNINKYHQESRMRLYKLNDENNLELLNSNVKIKDTFMSFNIEKGSVLVLSNKNTKSKNTSIVIIVSTIVILLEISVIGYIFYRRSKQTELPKLKTYLENPDFVDDDEK